MELFTAFCVLSLADQVDNHLIHKSEYKRSPIGKEG